MSNRRSLGSLLIANLDPELESKERVSQMVDLRDLNPKTETELYKTLNLMMSNKQYLLFYLDFLYTQDHY